MQTYVEVWVQSHLYDKADSMFLCYLLCSTDQRKGYLSLSFPTHVTTGSGWPPCYDSGSTDVAGLLRDHRPLQRQFLDGDRAGIKPNQTKSPFPKIHACPYKKQPAQLTHNEPIWNSSLNLIKL